MPRIKPRAAKNEQREFDIKRALEGRAEKGASFVDLSQWYGVPKSTLCDHSRGMQTRQKSHEAYQALAPAMEKALNEWMLKIDAQDFPPRLDIFKAVAEKLAQEEERDSLGPTWL